ncbi:Vacuolar protein sorting-associated protein 53 [Dermatophagoides pteronyssinus]|uniref:Replication protein A subunit n=1 Tax=Dermatophagoides pteronyssinus TaxID=6956 RepID=A0ABQ8J4L8_DERPT|nr:Vacuolar protein sorting-associated protein 53 [Dermatophagoides pteronyssinus]
MDIAQHVNNILENMIISNSPQTELTTIEYINKIFPNEQSLSNIDEVLKILKDKISVLDKEIRQSICSQKIVEENGRKTLENARGLILNLSTVIHEIKNQAKQSEKIVNEITCNIKQLDNAKRNLTLSIIMLNNLHILVQGTFILKDSKKKRQYGQASRTLQGILDVLKQFDRFKHIPHISKLTTDIDETCQQLGEQILGDFRETFETKNHSKPLQQNQIQLLAEGCLVLSNLDSKYRRQLITWLVDLELVEYKALFQDNQDIAWLDKIDQRFAWLKKHLIIFEDKIGFLFPPAWELSECIAVEFCKITRQDLIQVMNNRFIELDIFWFNNFTTKEKTNSKNVFTGLITSCFENYLNIYVDAQDKNFEKLINQFVLDEQTKKQQQQQSSINNQQDQESSTIKAEIFGSSGKLFTQYKNCLIQCISLSNRQPLVLLSETFQKYLREYANKILQNQIPPNYCLETTRQLEKKIQEKIDSKFLDKINMNNELDIFHGIVSNCLQLLSHSLENQCEQPLLIMIRTQWSNWGTPIGHSQYITSIISIFHQSIPLIRENLSDCPKYFYQFCQKFIQSFISKFIGNLFKCKPLSQGAAEQLLLDAHTLKKILLELPEYKSGNSGSKTVSPTSYTDTVIAGMTKAEMILKILLVPATPAEMFVENYFKLFQEKDLNEFQKIIEMKGIRKSESFQLIELFKKKIVHYNYEKTNSNFMKLAIQNSESDTSTTSTTTMTTTTMTSNNAESIGSIDSNRIKKLEKLIKNRLLDLILEQRRQSDQQPIVQILGSKIMSNNHIRAIVFDGQTICQHCIFISSEIDQQYSDGKLEKFTIIRLKQYSLSSIPKKDNIPVILVQQIEILRNGNEINRRLKPSESIDMEIVTESNEPVDSDIQNETTDHQSDQSSNQNQNNNNNIRPESITPINVLTPYFNAWTICGLCIHKSQIRCFASNQHAGRLFTFDLCDDSGEIHIVCFNDECDRFFNLIDEKQMYFVGRGMIKMANKRFTSIHNDYEITLTQSSFVRPVCNNQNQDQIEMPKMRYKFVELSSIVDIPANTMIDVIGVIRLVYDMKTLLSKKTSRQMLKRDIIIIDKSMVQVRLTLWDYNAENFQGQPDQIIALKGVIVNDYRGKILSTRDTTHILIEPDLPEKDLLKLWYQSIVEQNDLSINFKCLSSDQSEIKNDNFNKKRYIASITSIVVGQLLKFQTNATIIGFNPIKYHMYKSCASSTNQCLKKVLENEDGTYQCLKCNEKSINFQWRMIIQLFLADCSGSFYVTIFNNQIEQILKKSVSELATLIQTDENQYLKILNQIIFRQFSFNIYSRNDYYNGEMRLRNTVIQMNELKSKKHSSNLLQLIQTMIN